MYFLTLLTAISVCAFALVAKGSPTQGFAYQTLAQFNEWLTTTDGNITFIGEPIDRIHGVTLASRSALNTMVTYCSTRAGAICTTPCTVYNGPATCLAAPHTNCLAATNNVAFCDHGGCSGSCNNLDSCGTRLDNGFCWTPGTNSIAVSTA